MQATIECRKDFDAYIKDDCSLCWLENFEGVLGLFELVEKAEGSKDHDVASQGTIQHGLLRLWD